MAYISYAQLNSLAEFSFIAGTEYIMTFNAFQADGVSPLDLGGATITWVACPFGQSNYTAMQIAGVITATNTFTVTIPSDTSRPLSGKYIHQPVIVDFAGTEFRPAQGELIILPAITVE